MTGFFDFIKEQDMCLFTDFYELAMCASYLDNKKLELATFDLLIRNMPKYRSYFLFAGLEQVLLFLKNIRFTDKHLLYLRKQGFSTNFLDYLQNFRFTGDVWALPEGSIAFQNEPLIRITAPIIEAQIVETFLLNTINLQTMIATKASRIVEAAKGKPVIEFGLRREHGIDAGMKVARCSFIAGCEGTSNVLAGKKYGIPLFGTMAHSFIMSYEHEIDAFRAFTKTFPDKTTLLIDTYDEIGGVNNAILIAKELEKLGYKLGGVRLDSGNLAKTSKKIRKLLDNNDLAYVKIFVSGDLDEFKITKLLEKIARIDFFGVGTKLGTSADRPYLDVIYKLCEIMNNKGIFSPIMKLSEAKTTFPGRKQVYRFKDASGNFAYDIVALDKEILTGESLLIKVMEKGELIYNLPSIERIRNYAKASLQKLPAKYKKINTPQKYPVKLSQNLETLTRKLIIQLGKKKINTKI
ncbi:nicotinate phosphoribosyltransferase [Candidatus Bathyarchaeota archaeon]|nr:nicotinate phosphoribosyltransferase [Candidatus Bathyarchaeota archaeon]